MHHFLAESPLEVLTAPPSGSPGEGGASRARDATAWDSRSLLVHSTLVLLELKSQRGSRELSGGKQPSPGPPGSSASDRRKADGSQGEKKSLLVPTLAVCVSTW